MRQTATVLTDPAIAIPAQLLHAPVRQYPLRPLNEPPVIPLAQQQAPPQQQARAVAPRVQQQNTEMEARERQRTQLTVRARPPRARLC